MVLPNFLAEQSTARGLIGDFTQTQEVEDMSKGTC